MQILTLGRFFELWLMPNYFSIPVLLHWGWHSTKSMKCCSVLSQWYGVPEKTRKQWLIRHSVFEHDRSSCTFSRPGTFGSQELQRKLWVTSMLFKMKCWKCLVISSGFQYDFLKLCTQKSKMTSLLKWMWIFYPLNST